MRIAVFLIVLMAFAAGVARAQDGSLMLFHATSDDPADTDFTRINGEWIIDAGVVYTQYVHVYTRLSGATANGITGAEFYLDGVEAALDAGFDAWVTPNPLLTADFGSPIVPSGEQQERRYNIVFNTCQAGTNGFVFLASIRIQRVSPDGPPDGFLLQVVAGNPPSNAAFPCPLVTLCDHPVFSRFCVPGRQFCVGGPPLPVNPEPEHQAVDVSPLTGMTWSFGPHCCVGLSVPQTRVYFGTQADPPLVLTDYNNRLTSYDPPQPLNVSTTYYWRIETTPDLDCGWAIGSTWSFTTAPTVNVESGTWSAVKRLYRERSRKQSRSQD